MSGEGGGHDRLVPMSFSEFLAASPTSYHACAEVARLLEGSGFVEQREADPWQTRPGGYFVRREGTIIAYRLPKKTTADLRFHIVAAHSDSPGFKLKPHPEHSSAGWRQAGFEVYGSPLLNSWLDREFGLAGRVVLTSGEQRLIATDPWLRIPQLAPHLDRTVNDSLQLDKQAHLMPVYATIFDERDLFESLAQAADCAPQEIAGHDLFSYITQPPQTFGIEQQFLAAGRLDDLSSVYPGAVALSQATPSPGIIPILACFDHEEVGSQTRSGAGGNLLPEILDRIAGGLGLSHDEFCQVRARSLLVSADAGHSVNPNYVGMYDPDEQPIMGCGPMLKVNAAQHYTTDGLGRAMWEAVCERAEVPCQTFVSNNAVSCGTTIGPILAARTGLSTVDIGLPILSMHSAREMCAVRDPDYLAAALEVFFTG